VIIGLETIIKETAEYCSQRKAFGYPLINNQIIHYTLAELQTEVEALRALTYRAVGKWESVCLSVCLSACLPVSHKLNNTEI